MNNLYLMSLRADLHRHAASADLDPFRQAEPGALTTIESNVACEIWQDEEDMKVTGSHELDFSTWEGIIDHRSKIKAGDRLTNFRKANDAPLFTNNDYTDAAGVEHTFTVRVTKAAATPDHYIGLSLESVDGI